MDVISIMLNVALFILFCIIMNLIFSIDKTIKENKKLMKEMTDLLSQINEQNKPPEWDTGEPVGKEIVD